MVIKRRCYELLTKSDLAILRDLACRERELFFLRNSHLRDAYKDRLIAITLCQGAAKHYIDGRTGVKDLDIWWFYAENKAKSYPYRALKSTTCILPKFGRRKVDLIGRSIETDIVKRCSGDPIKCIREYLSNRQTTTARKLSEKAVIGLYPNKIFNKVIWPLSTKQKSHRNLTQIPLG